MELGCFREKLARTAELERAQSVAEKKAKKQKLLEEQEDKKREAMSQFNDAEQLAYDNDVIHFDMREPDDADVHNQMMEHAEDMGYTTYHSIFHPGMMFFARTGATDEEVITSVNKRNA